MAWINGLSQSTTFESAIVTGTGNVHAPDQCGFITADHANVVRHLIRRRRNDYSCFHEKSSIRIFAWVAELRLGIDGLERFPQMGQADPWDPSRRILTHPPYRIYYRIRKDAIEILSQLHGSRRHHKS